MTLKNYTPETLYLETKNGIERLDSEGVASYFVHKTDTESSGVLIWEISSEETYGLPKPNEDVLFIVTKNVYQMLKNERKDIAYPSEPVYGLIGEKTYYKSLTK